MTAADVVRAIRARWLLFTVCCIVPIAAAAFAAARAPAPVYSATAGLFVEPTRLVEGVNTYQTPIRRPSLPSSRPHRMHRW